MKDDNIVDWFSLENGTHVPIKKGESKKEATSKFLNKKMSRVAKNQDKYDKIEKFKRRKATNKEINTKSSINDFEVNEDKTKYEMRQDLREKYEKELGLRKNLEKNKEEPTPTKKANKELNNRSALMKFTQDNKEQIDKWVSEYDDDTHKRVGEKVSRGEGLTAKEYFGFLGSNMKPGSVILEEFADGENAVVANDGNWVRESRVKEYNKNPKAHQDAVYNEKEEQLKWDKLDRENPLPTLEELRNKYKNIKNSFRDDEFVKREMEKERIEEFKKRKKSNKYLTK